jgi:prepilin-type N-terminal cleavage/methylation domain-containing protein
MSSPNGRVSDPLFARQRRPKHFKGFSLVELVIVVIIIAIIAAIAVPRVSSAGRSSAESALIASLSTFRRAIETYAAEHDGTYPGRKTDGAGGGANSEAAFVSQMLKHSDSKGHVADSQDADHRFGPYLRNIATISVGPNANTKGIAIDLSNPRPLVTGGPEAWVYNPISGEIIANTDDANLAGTRAYDEY